MLDGCDPQMTCRSISKLPQRRQSCFDPVEMRTYGLTKALAGFRGSDAAGSQLADGRRWSYRLEPLVPKRRDVLLAETDQRPVAEIMTTKHVDPLDLLYGPALGRLDLTLVAFQKLSERRAFVDLCVWGSAEAIDLGFQIARPPLGFEFAVKGLAPRLHAATTHLRLSASS